MDKNNRISLLRYVDDATEVNIDVVFKSNDFWLTQKGMAELYGVKVPAISKHLRNIFG